MLQDLLSDRNKQAVEHEMEIQGLLQAMSAREQQSQVRTDTQMGTVPLSALVVCEQKAFEPWNVYICYFIVTLLGFFPVSLFTRIQFYVTLQSMKHF